MEGMEMEAVSAFEYHVVSYVPDFQTKPCDSRPAWLALICRFNMVVAKDEKCQFTILKKFHMKKCYYQVKMILSKKNFKSRSSFCCKRQYLLAGTRRTGRYWFVQ